MSGGISTFENMTSRRRKDTPPGRVVEVQSIKDSSYMESMVNFFHEIGQAYTNTSQVEEKETVLWARMFNYQNVLDPEMTARKGDDGCETFLLVLGYKNGIQVWIFEKNGEMREILSLRQGPVKTACLVPSPCKSAYSDLESTVKHEVARPLLAICMAADRKQLFTSVRITSLRTGDEVDKLAFDYDVEYIHAGSPGMLVITLKHEIQVFDTKDFELVVKIRECYPSPGRDLNPIAVADEWLAYSPSKPNSSCQSAGGMEDDGISSYAATMINAAKTIKKGLVNLGETVNWLAKSSMSSGEDHTVGHPREMTRQHTRNLSGGSLPEFSEGVPGLITVLNVRTLCKLKKGDNSPSTPGEHSTNGVIPTEAMVAHFPAHEQPIVCMTFSPCGSLLATADKRGHAFHIFSILPHPGKPKMSAVHHLYSLYRGDTSAKVLEMSFSGDCRWLCASTHRGTSHIFPISTYGGSATIRTHVSHRVVNRTSLFHKSAGLEDMNPPPATSGLGTNVLDGPTSGPPPRRARSYSYGSRMHNLTNPRLPPLPQPTLVPPLVQIGSTRTQQVLNLPKMTAQSNHSNKSDKTSASNWQANFVVASAFSNGRLKLSSSSNGHDNAHRRTPIAASSKGGQCLLIFNSTGMLTEYHLEPKARPGLSRVSDDSPIDMEYMPKFQWSLQRLISWDEVILPLRPTNPLLEIDNARRRYLKPDKNDVTLSSSFTSTQNKSTELSGGKSIEIENSGKDVVYINPDDCPKTQQPISRLRHGKTAGLEQFTGNTVLGGKFNSKNPFPTESMISSSSNHTDHAFSPRSLSSCDDGDCVRGVLITDHRRESDASDNRPSSADSMKSDRSLNLADCDEWLAQVEMVSHEGPARRLWMGPQFCFKLRQSTGSTMLLSSMSSAMFSNRSQYPTIGSPPIHADGRFTALKLGSHSDPCLDEDLDLRSLDIRPDRSEPMPTPKSDLSDQNELNSITIEAGSGNFDRAANMLEFCATFGSLEDRRSLPRDGEDKLREKIAEAMLDSEVNTTRTRGIRTSSDSSGTLECNGCADALLTVGGFEFEEHDDST